jgi:hypothetical protein
MAPPSDERRDIRPDLVRLLVDYPSLHAFFASISEPVMGNDSCFLALDDHKHFLQVIDWAFKTRDNSLNKMRTEGTALLNEVE